MSKNQRKLTRVDKKQIYNNSGLSPKEQKMLKSSWGNDKEIISGQFNKFVHIYER